MHGAFAVPPYLSTHVCHLLSLHLVSRVKMLDLFYFPHGRLAVEGVVAVPVLTVFPIGHHRDGFVA